MAEGQDIYDESRESPSTSVASFCKKKHGPYNQYLSQPGAKIPRTTYVTLKKWPEKSFMTTSTLEDDISLVTISNSNATCSRSSSIAIDYMETASAESLPSFLHQPDLSSERAFSEFPFNEYEADDHDNEQTFDFETHDQSDQSNLLEGEEIITPTESEQGTTGVYAQVKMDKTALKNILRLLFLVKVPTTKTLTKRRKSLQMFPCMMGHPLVWQSACC